MKSLKVELRNRRNLRVVKDIGGAPLGKQVRVYLLRTTAYAFSGLNPTGTRATTARSRWGKSC